MIKIGTRSSELALWQANTVARQLKNLGHSTKIIKIDSIGDQVLDKPLYELGVTGVFTKSLDMALINGDIDIAVHSLKDVPTFSPSKLSLACFLKRTDERDAFLSPVASSFANLKPGSTVGTSSVRRFSQLKRLRDDLKIIPMRGNIDTRINKMKEGI